MTNLDKVHYTTLYDLIQTRSGTVMNDHRRDDLTRLLDQLFVSGEVSDVPTLQVLLERETTLHPVWQQIIRAITIGETYFFRNQAHFHALRTQMFPELIRQRRQENNRQLRIWSAGCATGEEPYSLAILLRELIPDIEDWSITILGTDINHNFLAYAEEGIYSSRSFRGETPDWVQARWFTEQEGGRHLLKRKIRDMVYFKPLNLLNDEYPSYSNTTMNLDVIICRNVTIYFDLETTKQIVSRYMRALNTQGWLIVGHSEPQLEVYEKFTPINFEKAVFYQKPLPVVPTAAPVKAEVAPLETNLSARLHKMKEQVRKKPKSKPLPRKPKKTAPKPAKVRALAEVTPALKKGSKAKNGQVALDELWLLAKKAADDENWDEAMFLLAQADEQDTLLPQVHYLRGLVLFHNDQWDASLMSLRQAVYCDTGFALAHYSLGDLYAQRGESKDAARHWKHAQDALQDYDDDDKLPYGDDELTAEMLMSLITFRLSQLS